MKLRVIFTPDEREYSQPQFKILEGEAAASCLADLADMYGMPYDEEEVASGDIFGLIDELSGEEINLSFVQNVETGEVYFDEIFE